jgi:hypothetical protein
VARKQCSIRSILFVVSWLLHLEERKREMLYKYKIITKIIDTKICATGFYISEDGQELPIEFREITFSDWYDKYDNPKWELLGDGTVQAANIVPTPEQIAAKEKKDAGIAVFTPSAILDLKAQLQIAEANLTTIKIENLKNKVMA